MNTTNYSNFREENGYRSYMIKTYSWMFLGILITFGTAMLIAGIEELRALLFFSSMIPFILLFAQIGVVFALNNRLMNLRVSSARNLFIVYSLITGISFTVLFLVYDLGTLIYAFGMAAAYFGSLVVIGYTTKLDLSHIGTVCLAGLLGMIVFGLINLFIPMPQFNFTYSLIGLLIFAGITAWDAQKMKTMYHSVSDQETQLIQAYSIYSAFQLYLDFINIFLYVIRIVGRNND